MWIWIRDVLAFCFNYFLVGKHEYQVYPYKFILKRASRRACWSYVTFFVVNPNPSHSLNTKKKTCTDKNKISCFDGHELVTPPPHLKSDSQWPREVGQRSLDILSFHAQINYLGPDHKLSNAVLSDVTWGSSFAVSFFFGLSINDVKKNRKVPYKAVNNPFTHYTKISNIVHLKIICYISLLWPRPAFTLRITKRHFVYFLY